MPKSPTTSERQPDGTFAAGHVKRGGRQKGSANKLTTTVRSSLLEVFERLGGTTEFLRWAQKNPGDFYPLFVRSVPKPSELQTRASGVTVIVTPAAELAGRGKGVTLEAEFDEVDEAEVPMTLERDDFADEFDDA